MVLLVAKKSEPSSFGLKLKELRTASGLTQAALAEVVGMKRAQIAALETSPTANPTLATLRLLAAALGCTPADLIPAETTG